MTKVKNPFYNITTSNIGEPDIRTELDKILYIENRGSDLIYRRARRDSEGKPILSPTRMNNRSRERNIDIQTNISETMGYLFDDYLIKGMFNQTLPDTLRGKVILAGDVHDVLVDLYVPYNVLFKHTSNPNDLPDNIDQIIIPKFNIEGKIISPLQIDRLYDISEVEPYRLDSSGRVEFFKLILISRPERSYKS